MRAEGSERNAARSALMAALPLLAALTLLNTLNFADRFLLVAFSPDIIAELKLSHLEFGLLTGVVFTAVYTVMGLFAGALADRVHRPSLIAGGLALWSGLTAATGFAAGFAHMVAARLFVGVGEASLTPAALSMLADRVAPSRRALASGAYYLGLPAGIGGSFMFAAAVGPTLGWRGGFLLLGGTGVVAALLVKLMMRDPPRGAADNSAAPAPRSFSDSLRGLAGALRGNPAFAVTLAACTAAIFAQGATILDLLWWVKERGYTMGEAQRLTGLIFVTGGMAGAVLGGLGADAAQRRWPGGRLKFLGWSFLFAAPAALAYRLLPGHSAGFYVFALIGAMITMLLYGPGFSAVQEMVPVQHRAAALGVFLLCVALFGGGGGNAAVGWLSDHYSRTGAAEPITLAILTAQSVALLSIPLFFLAARMQSRSAAHPGASGTGAAAAIAGVS